jgi:hypothetical protein
MHAYMHACTPLSGVVNRGHGFFGHLSSVIEAPWLVNGGHGASLRHHIKDDADQSSALMDLLGSIHLQPALLSDAEARATAPPSAHTTRHHCNIIGAPWRVNGGHGASYRHHKGQGSCPPQRTHNIATLLRRRGESMAGTAHHKGIIMRTAGPPPPSCPCMPAQPPHFVSPLSCGGPS